MEEQKEIPTEEMIIDNKEWLAKELEETKANAFDDNKKPALKLEENKTVEIEVDFSQPFQKWEDTENKTIKKLIPVKVGDVESIWWLNLKNPIYHRIIEDGSKGVTKFKILQVGNQKNTKYLIVD